MASQSHQSELMCPYGTTRAVRMGSDDSSVPEITKVERALVAL